MEDLKQKEIEAVLEAIGLADAPEVVQVEVAKRISNGIDRVVIESFWKHLDEKQTEHFKDFSLQMAKIRPMLSAEGVLYEFMALYEDLTAKVSSDLDGFLEKFVADFRAEV
ncbi:hypothetical protein KA119_00235 [Candidatus Gracilibacteria bacterium]|nr:hypothetical protein [Candidatus Gracilibacteria bacterium]